MADVDVDVTRCAADRPEVAAVQLVAAAQLEPDRLDRRHAGPFSIEVSRVDLPVDEPRGSRS